MLMHGILLNLCQKKPNKELEKKETGCPVVNYRGLHWQGLFIRNSPILLLDEATSALDTENEEKIHQAMKKLTQGKTTIMIAHRFSSIRLANRIIVMDKGRIVSDGTHDELYPSCPIYRTLYDNQSE